MKPLHIVLLLVAGAGGGALVMMVAQHQQIEAPAPEAEVSKAPAGAQAVVTPKPEASAPRAVSAAPLSSPVVEAHAAQEPSRPSPWEAPRPQRTHTKPYTPPADAASQNPVIRPMPPPVAAAPPVTTQEPPKELPTPPQVKEPPAAQPNPPARVEPEKATPPQPPPPPEPAKVTLNPGTLLSVRLIDGLNAERNRAGDLFTATLDRELWVDGYVIAERGARVEGRVVSSDPGGRVRGVSTLAVELTRLHTSDGQNVAIRTDPFERRAESSRTEDAEKIGAGAAIGAAIGAIAGGGKGAAIGAGAGGAAGAGTVLATRGRPAALPSETRVTFRIAAPVTLTERR